MKLTILEANKSRVELAKSITSWAFGNPNMTDIDDNLAYLADRFFANNRAKGDMIYSCEEPDELIAVLSNCSEDVLRNIEIALCIDDEYVYGELDYIDSLSEDRVKSKQIYKSVLREKDVDIDVKHEGILEVPDGKNVDDLPMSHFEKLAKKKGLSKITKALNNLQVWNKNDDPELSKWAGNMIDKLNKKLKKDESIGLSESYLDYDWRNTYTTKELKEMSAEKLLDLKWYDADFTKAELVAVTDDYNNTTRRPLEEFFVGADDRIHTDKWYPVQTKDGLELFMRMNGRSSSIEVVAGMKKIKYGARVINRVVRAGKVTFDSFWTKDDFFKWILDVNFAQD